MIAKCGEVRVWHWAHRTKQVCDSWWENEGEWHRAWKGHFPESWQEIVHPAENGMRHIADVKTEQGWVIEFQHSHIKPEERRSRDAFYGKLVWVVNGLRLKRAIKQFMKMWEEGTCLGSGDVRKVFLDECQLLREWSGSQAPIFFDFGDEHLLWWLITTSDDGRVWIGKYARNEFIETLRGGTEQKPLDFSNLITWAKGQLATYETTQRTLDVQRARLKDGTIYRLLDVGRRRGRL
jgi:competence protein CoiA